MCPCFYGTLGVFLLTAALYLTSSLGGPNAIIIAAQANDLTALGIAAVTLGGAGMIITGLHQALSHRDRFTADSTRRLVTAAGIIFASYYALTHGWELSGYWQPFSRAAWLGLGAANAYNVWLNLRGFMWPLRERREPASTPRYRAPARPDYIEATYHEVRERRTPKKLSKWNVPAKTRSLLPAPTETPMPWAAAQPDKQPAELQQGCLIQLPDGNGGYRACGKPITRDRIFCEEHGAME